MIKPRLFAREWLLGLATLLWIITSTQAAAAAALQHPLDALEAFEYEATLQILVESGRVGKKSLYQLITLREPSKDFVKAWKPGAPVPRSSFAVIKEGPRTFEAVVDLDTKTLSDWREVEGVQPGILYDELFLAGELTMSDPRWQEAMHQRGVTDFEQVFCLPLSAGYYNLPDEEGRRLVKVPCNDLRSSKTNIMGKPIGGVFAIVDLNAREVVDVIDTGEIPIPDNSANYDRDSLGGSREPLKPVQQSSPRGNNFIVDGHVVRWQNWSFHFRMDKRAGLVVSLAGYGDGETTRPVMYQGYLSELFVPYMDPAVDMYWRTFMDVGEYGFGMMATSLAEGSDCAANAIYFPAILQIWGHGNPSYAGMVDALDAGVGRVLEALEAIGASENTVVLFVSDNGGLGGYDMAGGKNFTDNAPLRGGKGMLYEGGVRVPLIVRWPGVTPAGGVSDEPVICVDLFNTVIDIAGLSPPADRPIDGISIVALLRGAKTLNREAIYWHFPAYLEANRDGSTWRTTPAGAVRMGQYKLIELFETGTIELYDLETDISEKRDLSESSPELTARIHQNLEAWRETMNAPMPEPRKP